MIETRSQLTSASRQRGFSLIELLVVIAILSIVVGAIFTQIDQVQQRSVSEQSKLDEFQEARDFVDQFFRDINQVGVPNGRTVPVPIPLSAATCEATVTVACGLVLAQDDAISFEGALYGTGTIQTVTYQLNGTGACPTCLQRSQVDKGNAAIFGTQVNGVAIDPASGQTTVPIFTYFDTKGTKLATPVLGASLAQIKTIQINLVISDPSVRDLKTMQAIQVPFQGEVSINNCSMMANSQPMSCF